MTNCKLNIKVVAGAARDEIMGWLGGELKVRVQAPPTDGKANERLCVLLAQILELPRHSVRIFAGASSRKKIIMIEGISPDTLYSRLPPK